MNLKKAICMLIATSMAIFSFAGCTSSDTKSKNEGEETVSTADSSAVESATEKDTAPDKKVEIEYCYWGAESEAKVRKGAADSFNASQDKIVVKPIFIDSGTYMAKLPAYFAAGNAPDVLQSSGNFGDTYITKGLLEDLTPYIEKDGLKDSWNQLLVDNYTYDGKIYAAPLIFNSFYLIYNKALFDAAKVPYPTNDWTEEQFLDTAKKLTKGEGADKIYGIRLSWLPPTMLPNFYGNPIFDEASNKLNVAGNEEFKAGIQFLSDLALKEGVAPDAAGEKAAGTGFVSGKFAMEISAMWDMEQIMKTVGDSFAFDIVKFPVNAKYGRWRTPVANVGFYMDAASKNKDAAWEFIKYATTDKTIQTSMNLVGIPAAKSVTEAPDFLTTFPDGWKPIDKAVVKDLDAATIWPSDTGVWAKIMTDVTAQWDLIMNKKATVDEAVAAIQKAGDAAINKAK